MSKFSNTGLSLSAFTNLAETNQKVKSVINSKLTDEEKIKALTSFKRERKLIITFVLISSLIYAILLVFGCVNLLNNNTNFGIWYIFILNIIYIISVIFFAIFNKSKQTDWKKYATIVDYGWDGLSKIEIEKLMPSNNDDIAIKKYKNKSIIANICLVLALIIEFLILFLLKVSVYSPLTIIITIIIIIVWYMIIDNYEVEIHRLKSGYYKKDYSFKCSKCETLVSIKFEEIEKYESLPKNEKGIRIMKCPSCGNDVQIFNFDRALSDYKKFKNINNK